VVADNVVQLAGQLATLAQSGLLDVTDAGVGMEADRRTERGSEQKEPIPA
jgi:hypothetical protein